MDKQYEMKIRKRRQLERRVLQHLKDHQDKPRKFDGLYVLSDPDLTMDIAPALAELRHWGHIKVVRENNVTITDEGLQRLERQD